jgi:hypothetical protein
MWKWVHKLLFGVACPSIIKQTGANPTIVSYNPSTVKFDATSSLVRFVNKKYFQLLSKTGLAYYSAGVVACI